MKNRFKLTTGFLIVSVAIFVIAAVVITNSAERNEKANLIEVVSQQSSRDAHVIAGVLTGALETPVEPETGFGSPVDQAVSYESLAMTTFLRNSDIVKLSLIKVDGSLIWSSATDAPSQADGAHMTSDAFIGAVNGETATHLVEDVEFSVFDGTSTTGDLISTYIPLLDASTERPSQILEVTRDVTGTLDARIDTARSSMFRTVFGTLGGSFFVLFGVVLSADLIITRSRERAVSHERALADEKIIASKLELENQQLRQLNEERDRFLSMVSHELRTPLTTIMGFTDVLRRRQGGDRKDTNIQHLDLMRRNGEHLNALIEEMLEITRIQAGKFEVVKEGFLLDHLLVQVEASGRMLMMPRRQRLVIDNRVENLELHGDQRRVMQVLMNLPSNASKYSPENSTITLLIEQAGASVRMSVVDQGAGIPRDECELLFERFYRRNDEATRSQSGLGLGLTIVKAIVDAHHGTVEINSVVGLGTTMTVTLPGARKAGARSVAPATPEREMERAHLRRMRDLRSLPAGAQAAS
ncbi:MAG: HAMP domain-containing sensor histidine kinase [Chloroflexi bacterium]|nr:HAMP domain-containing sensor histidine kinase [Chloroflexota bacterium]